jgi:predicted CXXCH cytochrome family protein
MDDWKNKLTCLTQCTRCHNALNSKDSRILSSYDHEPICMNCKKDEEMRPDYEEISKRMIGQCMIDTELKQEDPEAFCFNHFYPYKC